VCVRRRLSVTLVAICIQLEGVVVTCGQPDGFETGDLLRGWSGANIRESLPSALVYDETYKRKQILHGAVVV
jgi:hypothetical protein